MIWYHGTTLDNWKEIQTEGVLWGKRERTAENPNVCRCTYLAAKEEDAAKYGEIVLEVIYEPLDASGDVRRDVYGPVNNYAPTGWQIRVYEPIPIENVKRIR